MGRKKFELKLGPQPVGRPGKARELRTEDGRVLLEKEEFMFLAETTAYIEGQEKAVIACIRNTIARYFRLGQILETMNQRVGAMIPRWWLEKNLKLSRHTVDTARKVYSNKSDYMDENGEPRKNGWLFQRKDKQEHLPSPQMVFPQRPVNWIDVERLPVEAAIQLRHYRIRAEPTDGNFYLYHNDDVPVPIVSLEVDLPRNFQQEAAFERLRKGIQKELERYYAVIEQTEEDWTQTPLLNEI